MKPVWLIIILLSVFGSTASSQSNKAYCAQEITWFGLDYSKAHFIDSKAFPDPYALQNKLFHEWNQLVFREKKKFDIGKSFNKSDVKYSIDYVNQINSSIDILSHITNDRYKLIRYNNDSIQKIIDTYQINEKVDGVGLVFIVESLNKINYEANYWVTFFDIKSRKVLLTEQVTGKPSGAGLHNYWANSFYDALNKSARQLGFIF